MKDFDIPTEVIEKCAKADYEFWTKTVASVPWEEASFSQHQYRKSAENTIRTFLEAVDV